MKRLGLLSCFPSASDRDSLPQVRSKFTKAEFYIISFGEFLLPSEIVDMSSNVNPLGPPTGLVHFLKKNIDAVTCLPEVDSREITNHFARHFDLDPDRLLAGNGTTQFIYMIPHDGGGIR